MGVSIIKGDITTLKVDAIVNAANSSLRGGGGVDGAIHRKAGPLLDQECRGIGRCPQGEARITKGYNLPAKYVIHTVGPIYRDGKRDEEKILKSCYRSVLKIVNSQGFTTVAFPLISGGVYGYPVKEAISVALFELNAACKQNKDLELTLVLFKEEDYKIAEALFPVICR